MSSEILNSTSNQEVPCPEKEIAARIAFLFNTQTNKQKEHAENDIAETAMFDEIRRLGKTILNQSDTGSDHPLESFLSGLTDAQMPETGTTDEKYLNLLEQSILPEVVNVASPRFIGHMTSALPYFVRPLSHLIAAWNQNLVKVESSKILTGIERQLLAMLHQSMYRFHDHFYETNSQAADSTLGMFVSGGTLANLAALWCARNAVFHNAAASGNANSQNSEKIQIDRVGLPAALKASGYEGAVIIGSELMHYSFDKGADILGIGMNSLVKISVDENHRIHITKLKETIQECREKKLAILAIVGIAGTTDSGAIDPLEELAEIASKENIHFHVDAAWGGPICFSTKHRSLLQGIEKADSIAMDAHKQLYCPMGVGMVLFRDPFLADVIEKTAPYIIREGAADLGKRSLEGSRSAASLYVHGIFHLLGREGIEYVINHGIQLAQNFAKLIVLRPDLELLIAPQCNILLYRSIPASLQTKAARKQLSYEDEIEINNWNKRLQQTQRDAGQSFVSRTTIPRTVDGKPMDTVSLRVVLANPLTTESDIHFVLEDQQRIIETMTY